MLVHSKRYAQIEVQIETKIRALLFDKVFTKVLIEYFNYNNIFSIKNIVKLPENTEINEYIIELEESK